VNRFDPLSPYNRKIVPHLLRLTDENYDIIGSQRQLFGLSIAAKRYALFATDCCRPYCAHRNCVTIVNPKAHGLIFFALSDERENGLPKWWWELWRFLLTLEFKQIIAPESKVLMVAGRVIDADTASDVDGLPSWISLPAMMKMRISTPHYFDQMKGKSSPFGFVLHPRTRDGLKLTLLTPFNKNRSLWALSPRINTRDGRSIRPDELSRADVITLGDIVCGYIQHPEVKSLGPDGQKSNLIRADCFAGWQSKVAYTIALEKRFRDLNRAEAILSRISMTSVFTMMAGVLPQMKARLKKSATTDCDGRLSRRASIEKRFGTYSMQRR